MDKSLSSDKRHIDWPEIVDRSTALADKLRELTEIKGVIAITTGGMIPACLVSRLLGVKNIQTFCISTYNDTERGANADIFHAPALLDHGDKWVVIDDLVDSGRTLTILREHYPKAVYGCLYAKPEGQPLTDHAVEIVTQDAWLVFPWEIDSKTYEKPSL